MTRDAERRRERRYPSTNGYAMVALGIELMQAGIAGVAPLRGPGALMSLLELGALGLGAFVLTGRCMLQPNEGAILTLLGEYKGTDRSEGLRWANPFCRKRHISLRVRNLNAPTWRVNDKRGNPVENSAVVVWRVRDTAAAVFEVDNYESHVAVQAEAAMVSKLPMVLCPNHDAQPIVNAGTLHN